ncbi:MAG: toprim domain-containing protein [Anaerolinea sp.]|nr:toprim domain-containing protein [Anaerolinea sp.]
MIDVEKLKLQIDLRLIVERDLGKSRYHGRDYAVFKCPLHHEQKGWSLVVYSDHWRCYGKCQIGGDVIAWAQHYHQLTFYEACERLANGDLPQIETVNGACRVPESMAQPPDAAWQATARHIIDEACARLWSPEGQRAWGYLVWERGLSEQTIRLAQIGYLPGAPTAWREIEGLNVPCGILIPWIVDDAVWGIKVRRAAGEQRYQQVSGGNIRGSLYLADQVQPGLPLIVTEGEFDALIAWQVGSDFTRAAAIGSASHACIDRRWYGSLLGVPRMIACMDADAAGAGAATQLAALSGAVRCVQVPSGKDLSEYYQQAGENTVKEWLQRMVDQ